MQSVLWTPKGVCLIIAWIMMWASLVAQLVKNLPAVQETRVPSWVGKSHWIRKWQTTLVSLSGKSHRQRSLAGYGPWGCKEPDTTKRLNWTEYVAVGAERRISTDTRPGRVFFITYQFHKTIIYSVSSLSYFRQVFKFKVFLATIIFSYFYYEANNEKCQKGTLVKVWIHWLFPLLQVWFPAR